MDKVMVFAKKISIGARTVIATIARNRTVGKTNQTVRIIKRERSITIAVIHLRYCGLFALMYAFVFVSLIQKIIHTI